MHEVLAVAEHAEADRLAVAAGVSPAALMEAAGAQVAAEIRRRWTPRRVLVLCGPGNNGGDGFVVARHLTNTGWEVVVALLCDPADLSGDAAAMAQQWRGEVTPPTVRGVEDAELVVDALFGAGLSRPLSGAAAAVISRVRERRMPTVAVDIPSGVFGDTGAAPRAAPADLTVTFFRKKPGHLLYPGRSLCGDLVVADIGTPDSVIERISPAIAENAPAVWASRYPWPTPEQHKYDRGHAVVVAGGPASTGAARLAARAAQRVGAGVVTLTGPVASLPILAGAVTEVLTEAHATASQLVTLLGQRHRNAVLIGPGNGVSSGTRDRVLAVLNTPLGCVVDADGLSAFGDAAAELFRAIHDQCVLTPHDGEFARLFPDLAAGEGRLVRASAAARRSGAVVLLKGADTVIAAPDGRAAINSNAPPDLATAGSGDVLAGFVVGLLAQGMPAFEAACAATWLHGETATRFGPGLVAGDLPEHLPGVLRDLRGQFGGRSP